SRVRYAKPSIGLVYVGQCSPPFRPESLVQTRHLAVLDPVRGRAAKPIAKRRVVKAESKVICLGEVLIAGRQDVAVTIMRHDIVRAEETKFYDSLDYECGGRVHVPARALRS